MAISMNDYNIQVARDMLEGSDVQRATQVELATWHRADEYRRHVPFQTSTPICGTFLEATAQQQRLLYEIRRTRQTMATVERNANHLF